MSVEWNRVATLLHVVEKAAGHPSLKSILDAANFELLAEADNAAKFVEEKRAEKVEADRVAAEEAAAAQAAEVEEQAEEHKEEETKHERRA